MRLRLSGMLVLAAFLLKMTPVWAAEPPPQELSYVRLLDEVTTTVARPLINVLSSSGKKQIDLAVAQIREASTGQRSEFCVRLEKDLASKIRANTAFGVKGASDVEKALAPQGGEASDLGQSRVIADFCKAAGADAVLTGLYLVRGNAVQLWLSLYGPESGGELWSDSYSIPLSELVPRDLKWIPDSRPPGYEAPQGATVTASVQLNDAAAPAGITPVPTPGTAVPSKPSDDGLFAWGRVSLGAGLQRFVPQNETFQSVTGDFTGPYFRLNWANLISLGFDFWNLPGAKTGGSGAKLGSIGALSAYALSLDLSAPWRLGPYVIAYGGFGGRFESIQVTDNALPPGAAVSFGNDTFYGCLGLKLHERHWGLDIQFANDLAATDSGYLRAQAGVYYEIGD